MSFIPCTENCLYQKDGRCRLERVPSMRQMPAQSGCIYRCDPSQPNAAEIASRTSFTGSSSSPSGH